VAGGGWRRVHGEPRGHEAVASKTEIENWGGPDPSMVRFRYTL